MSEDQWRSHVKEQFQRGHKRMDAMQEGHDTLSKVVGELNETSKEFLEVFKAGKGGLKVLGWAGECLKWIGIVVGTITTLYKTCTGKWPSL